MSTGNKLSSIDDRLVFSLGGYNLRGCTFLPAEGVSGTWGGILTLWNSDVLNINSITKRDFSLSATVSIRATVISFLLLVVYDPMRGRDKPLFLQEIRSLAPHPGVKWIILGDFNLIYRASDKNNTNLNINNMRCFRDMLNSSNLKEIHLQNKKFTWSNERCNPTLVRLDRVFCNDAWDLAFPTHVLQAISSSHSDHCPLLLSN